MATLSTKYVDSEVLLALLKRLNKMYKSLKDYTDSAVEGIDYTEYVTDAAYDSGSATINFTNQNGDVVSSVNAADFIRDGMISAVSYDSSTAVLTFSFNTDAGQEDITVDLASLIDIYEAGDGISVDDHIITAVKSSSSEDYLSISSDGIAVTGIDAIEQRVTAVENWVDSNVFEESELDLMIYTIEGQTGYGFASAMGLS